MWPPLSAGTLLRVHPPPILFNHCPGRKRLASSLPLLEGGMRGSIAREGFFTEVSFCFIPFYSTLRPFISSYSSSPSHSSACVSFIIPRFLCPAEIAEHGRNNFLSRFCGIDLEVCGKIRFTFQLSLSLSLSLGNRMTRSSYERRRASSFFLSFFFVKEERIGRTCRFEDHLLYSV